MTLLMLLACNSYETFRVTGYEQANFSNDADILFVIDNSSSMTDEAEALALNFEAFIGRLTSSEGANVPHATLSDAMANYLRETKGDALFIDYQLAITTSSVDWSNGATADVEPGEAGTLTGDILKRNTEEVAAKFREQLVCEATCWSTVDMTSDPSYDCEDPPVVSQVDGVDQITIEYLDCVCGVDAWQGHCGAGAEMGIEAAYMAMCRASEDPPDDCYDFPESVPIAFTSDDEGSNAGFLREGANTIVVIVTDEGDDSPRKDGTGDNDIAPYIDLFSDFASPVRFAVIGPYYEDGEIGCNSGGALPWAVERYQNIATETLGKYIPIVDGTDPACAPTDFAENLTQIGDLLENLLTLFTLQAVPDAATIRVWVDGVELERSSVTEGDPLLGTAVYTDGWTYDAAYNAVRFNGAAVPDYNADVKIYYRPLGGTPRSLPF